MLGWTIPLVANSFGLWLGGLLVCSAWTSGPILGSAIVAWMRVLQLRPSVNSTPRYFALETFSKTCPWRVLFCGSASPPSPPPSLDALETWRLLTLTLKTICQSLSYCSRVSRSSCMMRVSLRLSYNYYRILSSANSLALDLVLRTLTKNEEQGRTVPLGTPEITLHPSLAWWDHLLRIRFVLCGWGLLPAVKAWHLCCVH